jgi:hypothetical protein
MIMAHKKEITPADILPPAEYTKRRAAMRAEIVAKKKNRRLEVGPVATFYFECYETMLQQVQEMLHIERGGEAQIADELSAYNPLIPKGNELVATVMFEIDDPVRRARVLGRLGGVENAMFIKLGEDKIMGVPEPDQDRTTAEGKASSVQFVHFPFSRAQIERFRKSGETIIVGIEHENYAHMAVMSDSVRKELAGDFD